jgi:anti-anti-sigma regulatory factor
LVKRLAKHKSKLILCEMQDSVRDTLLQMGLFDHPDIVLCDRFEEVSKVLEIHQ